MTVFACLCCFTYCFVNLYSTITLMGLIEPLARLGLYTTFYYLGYLFCQFPGGALVDRKGPKKLILLCTALCGLTTALTPLSLVMRVFSGMSCGPIMACASRLIASRRGKEKTKGLGVLFAAPPFGLLISNSLTPLLMSRYSISMAFSFLGLMAIPLVLLGLVVFHETPASSRTIVYSQKEALVCFVGNPWQMMLCASGFIFMFVVVGFGAWGRHYYQTLSLSSFHINLFMSLFSLFAAAGSIVSGYIKKRHECIILFAFGCMAIGFAVFHLFTKPITLAVFSALFGFVCYLPSAHFTSLAISLAPSRYLATAASIQNFFLQLGAFIMPFVSTFVLEGTSSYENLWRLFALLLLLGSLPLCVMKATFTRVAGTSNDT
jgi:MFS family permease